MRKGREWLNRAILDTSKTDNSATLINRNITFQHLARMDRETLSNALINTSAASVAALFGVSRRTIYRWFKQHGVPRRVYRCPNPALLRRLDTSGVLQKEIARNFGVSRWTIHRWCRQFGIIHHTTGRFQQGTKGNLPHIHEECHSELACYLISSGIPRCRVLLGTSAMCQTLIYEWHRHHLGPGDRA